MVENRVNFKLRYMLASSDEEFEARVKEAVERRRRFESGAIFEQPSASQNDDRSDIMPVSELLPDNLVNHSEL